jgi:hypothetical protein
MGCDAMRRVELIELSWRRGKKGRDTTRRPFKWNSDLFVVFEETYNQWVDKEQRTELWRWCSSSRCERAKVKLQGGLRLRPPYSFVLIDGTALSSSDL